jgi:predicted ArsR family transcriptional regulator
MIQRHQRLRALAGTTRLQLLDLLRRSGRPLSVQELAVELGLHENSVREQLARLVAGELVMRVAVTPSGRGRPPLRYSATASVADEREAGAFRRLALALSDQIVRQPNAMEAASEAGERWGRAISADLPKALDDAAAMSIVMALLNDAGFAPVGPDGMDRPIVLHRCPFSDLAVQSGGVICNLHLGMLRGVLREIYAPLVATSVVPFAAPGVCYAFIERRVVG